MVEGKPYPNLIFSLLVMLDEANGYWLLYATGATSRQQFGYRPSPHYDYFVARGALVCE